MLTLETNHSNTTSFADAASTSLAAYRCAFCCSDKKPMVHHAREMFFGTRERFDYHECDTCGSLQIASIPSDLGRHYSGSYYSHVAIDLPGQVPLWRDWMRRQRTSHRLRGGNLFGTLLQISGKEDSFFYPWEWFERTRVTPRSKILDVGCGNGRLLFELRRNGFNRLVGVDPFSSESKVFDGVSILKQSIFETLGPFDLIMSHHSLEHTPNPAQTLEKMRSLAASGGFVLVRLPVVNLGWKQYGVNWVALDPPRHLFIPSVDGLKALVSRVGGMMIDYLQFDSNAFELCASELYRRDIPLYPPELNGGSSIHQHFDAKQWQEFELHAQEMNRRGTAGSIAMYLRVL